MLTRFKVSGFKNLVDTEVHFGPFTCIAGFNGVGKSNIFDAIHFLSLLADDAFATAASKVRGGDRMASLFTKGGEGRMSFECDMIIPRFGVDDFNQKAEASHTFLTYALELQLKLNVDKVEVLSESLDYISRTDAKKRLRFKQKPVWQQSVIHASARRRPFISTLEAKKGRIVRLSRDKTATEAEGRRGGGSPRDWLIESLPRTVLSAAQNADEARTVVLARAEMRNWRILQLEPSSLRRPDEFQAPTEMSASGENLPATLYRLAEEGDRERVYAQVANRLSELVDNVRAIRIDRDDSRRLLRLVLTDGSGMEYAASSLSDGTLRFVALSVLELDSQSTGVLCFEEPENGIHPERMRAMIDLLRDMATDTEHAVGPDNPLRQVIVSTHSPVVVARVELHDLVFADHRDPPSLEPGVLRALHLRGIQGYWREQSGSTPIGSGAVLSYLGALKPEPPEPGTGEQDETVFAAMVDQLSLFGEAS